MKKLILPGIMLALMAACSPRDDKPGNNSDMNNKSTKGIEYESDSTVPLLSHDSSTRIYQPGEGNDSPPAP